VHYFAAILKNPRTTYDLIHMPHRTADKERRRSPRFCCGGHAQITRLPSEGIFLPATIRDLSLHGCCVDTALPIDCGTRAEIVVRVSASSFRAVGEVRAIRGPSGAGMEFVHLSAGGQGLLADLVAELAKLQAVVNKLMAARREMNGEAFREQLKARRLQAAMLGTRFPSLGSALPEDSLRESSEPDQAASAGKNPGKEAQPFVITVDLFG
jgi:hypothetical protein